MMRRLLVAVSLAGLAACASSGTSGGGGSPTPNPHQKIGVPYKINGHWYRPADEPGYDRTGVASWYGPKFHGKLTANGEIFDMNRLTAAHKTLPLPSLVRVTNVENGRSVVVRLNDRGPFAGDRLIDLSRAAAEALGTRRQGLASVRVQYLGPAPLSEAIVRLGAPESHANDRFAAVQRRPAPVPAASPSSGPVRGASGVVPSTVRTRIERGEELPPEEIAAKGIAVVVAEAEDAVPAVAEPRADAWPVQWYVQVGAFADPGNAARASARLPSAVPIALATDEAGLTRLRVGPYRDEFPAREALRVAQAAGFPDAALMKTE